MCLYGKGIAMSFSYKPLWKRLIDLDMTRSEIPKFSGVNHVQISKMVKGECIDMKYIHMLCEAFDCNIEGIVEFVNDGELTKPLKSYQKRSDGFKNSAYYKKKLEEREKNSGDWLPNLELDE